MKTRWQTHKIFSICNLVILAESQCEQAAIRFHCRNTYLCTTENPPLPAWANPFSHPYSFLFLPCFVAANQRINNLDSTISKAPLALCFRDSCVLRRNHNDFEIPYYKTESRVSANSTVI